MGRGLFSVIEGLDATGKGLIQKKLVSIEKNKGKIIRDGIDNSKHFFLDAQKSFEEGWNPKKNTEVLMTEEPTHYGIGLAIRAEIIEKNSRNYSSDIQIQMYSLDRLVQMKRLVIPYLESYQDVIQSRNFASTLCYQSLWASNEEKTIESIRDKILNHPGNQIELEYSPNLMIIATISDVAELMKRLKDRDKKDNCIFENLKFQNKLKPFYEDPWLKELFEKHGTTIAYLDAGISEEFTIKQAIEIYIDFYERKIVREKYQNPS